MFDWKSHDTGCDVCNYEGEDSLTREPCIQYVLHLGGYTRDQIEPLWPAPGDDLSEHRYDERPEAAEFFSRYAQLKSEDEVIRICACGNSTEFYHPWFGVTGGFGPMGACTCEEGDN